MADFNLPQTQKNEVLAMILAAGLDFTEFVWRQDMSSIPHGHAFTVEVLVHPPTGSRFESGVDTRGSLHAIFQPGPNGSRVSEHAGTWPRVREYAQQWVDRVQLEHEAPDLWAAAAEQRELLSQTEVENTPFTPAEQTQIAELMNEVMEYLRATSELQGARLDRIESELNYLVDATQRLRRLDWRKALLGSFMDLFVEAERVEGYPTPAAAGPISRVPLSGVET